MNVTELIALLEDYDGDLEVRYMAQPNWPFEYSLDGLVSSRNEMVQVQGIEVPSHSDDHEAGFRFLTEEEAAFEIEQSGKKDCVFLLEGSQLCYGSKDAWEER